MSNGPAMLATVLKICSIHNVNYSFLVLAVNFGTQLLMLQMLCSVWSVKWTTI